MSHQQLSFYSHSGKVNHGGASDKTKGHVQLICTSKEWDAKSRHHVSEDLESEYAFLISWELEGEVLPSTLRL